MQQTREPGPPDRRERIDLEIEVRAPTVRMLGAVYHDNPACAPTTTSSSNNARSS